MTLEQIHFFLLMNRQGKVRLSKYFNAYSQKERGRITRDIHQLFSARMAKMANVVEWRELKVVYKR